MIPAAAGMWLWLWPCVSAAAAGVPVVLPRGELEEDWVEPLALAGLEPGPPRDGPWIIVAETDGRWWMVVRSAQGAVVRTEVDPPTSPAAREELAFLAASLLRTVAPAVAASVPEEDVGEVIVAPPVRMDPPPPQPVVPEPAPAPVVADGPVAPGPQAPDNLGWTVHVGGVGGLGTEPTVAAGASVAAWTPLGLNVGLNVDHATESPLRVDEPGSFDLSRWELGGFVGGPGPQASWWAVGVSASWRILQTPVDGSMRSVIPQARTQFVLPLQVVRGPTLALLGLGGLDLRATEVWLDMDGLTRLPGWTAGLAVGLTQRTTAPWSRP